MTVFIYDGVSGGVGLAERVFEVIEGLLEKVADSREVGYAFHLKRAT
ncbi:hypothetical protein DFAR_1260045 [Desulfarculales bacterium]